MMHQVRHTPLIFTYMLKHEASDYMPVVVIFYMLEVGCTLISSRYYRLARLMISYFFQVFVFPQTSSRGGCRVTLTSLLKASTTCVTSHVLHARVLVQTYVTYYTATSIVPLYSSTILYHPVDSSFTIHINTHSVPRPHARLFPATVL